MHTTFRTLVRENTGSALCDSGIAYGYQYNRPAVPADMPLYYARRASSLGEEPEVFISLAVALADAGEIDVEETQKFLDWAAPKEECWLDLMQKYTVRGYAGLYQLGRPRDMWIFYTYNAETDLDQDYQIVAESPDSLYGILQTHNGCDARGGFSQPVVVRFNETAYAVPMRMSMYCPACTTEAEGTDEMRIGGWRVRHNATLNLAEVVCPNGHIVMTLEYR